MNQLNSYIASLGIISPPIESVLRESVKISLKKGAK